MKAWFISDIHLKSLNERNGNILLRFLHSLRDKKFPATHLFLLGDIFDFWVGDHNYYSQKFSPFVEALTAIRQQGVHVVYVEGNHDVHVKDFWLKQGIDAFVEDRYFDLGTGPNSLKIRVSHGDLINPRDEKYLKYRSLIRRSGMEKLAQLLPAKQLHAIGDIASQNSRKKSSTHRRDSQHNMKLMIHEYAEKCFQEQPFDFIISGHMHFRDEWTFNPGNGSKKAVSINLGSWFDKPLALVMDESGYRWQEL